MFVGARGGERAEATPGFYPAVDGGTRRGGACPAPQDYGVGKERTISGGGTRGSGRGGREPDTIGRQLCRPGRRSANGEGSSETTGRGRSVPRVVNRGRENRSWGQGHLSWAWWSSTRH